MVKKATLLLPTWVDEAVGGITIQLAAARRYSLRPPNTATLTQSWLATFISGNVERAQGTAAHRYASMYSVSRQTCVCTLI